MGRACSCDLATVPSHQPANAWTFVYEVYQRTRRKEENKEVGTEHSEERVLLLKMEDLA